MTTPTQILRDEHTAVLCALDVLDRVTTAAAAEDSLALDHARQLLDFLTTFVDTCHHGKEERELFPALEAAGVPRDGGPIGMMLAEHEEGRGHIRAMRDAAGEPGTTPDAGAIAERFVPAARAYAVLLREHIEKENEVLFRMAEQVLPPDKQAELVEAFAAIERDVVGPGKHEAYHKMLDELAKTYGVKAAH